MKEINRTGINGDNYFDVFHSVEKQIHASLEKHIHDARSGKHMHGTDLEKVTSGMYLERSIDRLKV